MLIVMSSWQQVKENLPPIVILLPEGIHATVYDDYGGTRRGHGGQRHNQESFHAQYHVRMTLRWSTPSPFCSACGILAFPFEHYEQLIILLRKTHLSLDIVHKLPYPLLISQQAPATACSLKVCIAASLSHVFRLLLLLFSSPFKKLAAIWLWSFIRSIPVENDMSCAMMTFQSRSYFIDELINEIGWAWICCLSSLGHMSLNCYENYHFCCVWFSPLLDTRWLLLPSPFISGVTGFGQWNTRSGMQYFGAEIFSVSVQVAMFPS